MLDRLIPKTDIYLIDQILKGRYLQTDKILDAGCGSGRNLTWFYENDVEIYGVDQSIEALEEIKRRYPKVQANFSLANLDELPFEDDNFNHIICSAVLHFAESEMHFKTMFKELVRVLKPGGSLFIRMTTDYGVEQTIRPMKNGVFFLKDESYRFLLTRKLLESLILQHHLNFLEPFKTTLVEDLRSMATIVLQKK